MLRKSCENAVMGASEGAVACTVVFVCGIEPRDVASRLCYSLRMSSNEGGLSDDDGRK